MHQHDNIVHRSQWSAPSGAPGSEDGAPAAEIPPAVGCVPVWSDWRGKGEAGCWWSWTGEGCSLTGGSHDQAWGSQDIAGGKTIRIEENKQTKPKYKIKI